MSLPERFSSRRTPFDLAEMALSSSLVSLPAPGISRSIRYCGIAPPFLVGSAEGRVILRARPEPQPLSIQQNNLPQATVSLSPGLAGSPFDISAPLGGDFGRNPVSPIRRGRRLESTKLPRSCPAPSRTE